MARDPLAWLPLLRHWTQCLGEGPDAIPQMGDLGALPELDMAALLPGGPGWSDVQRSLRHDPEGAFRLLYYGLALRSLVAMANGTRFEVIVADDASSDATHRPSTFGPPAMADEANAALNQPWCAAFTVTELFHLSFTVIEEFARVCCCCYSTMWIVGGGGLRCNRRRAC